jgi:hypothetical protein
MTTLAGFIDSVRSRGPLRSVRHYWIRLLDRWWEARFGVRTEGLIPLESVGIENREFGRYSPTSYTELRALMRRIPIRPGQDVFMDYGSGLGRVLIVAATHPFRRVVGVEVVESFNATAAANFERCRKRLRCTDLELLTSDASLLIPPADVTMFFFYTPFGPVVLKKVLDNISQTLVERPRKVTLVFRHPGQLQGILGEVPWLRKRAAHAIGEYEYWILDNAP